MVLSHLLDLTCDCRRVSDCGARLHDDPCHFCCRAETWRKACQRIGLPRLHSTYLKAIMGGVAAACHVKCQPLGQATYMDAERA